MEEQKKNRLIASAVTVAVHAAILLLLLFYTLSAPEIREDDGSGIVLQLGVIDAEAGTFTPMAAAPSPQPVDAMPVVTQDIEETVSLDEEKPEPEVAPDLSEKKAEPQPEPETSPIDDLWADALSKGKTADSIAANDQKKGSPQGHAAAGATVGSPGYGDYDFVQANVTPSGSKGTAASNATLRSRAEAAARRAVFERKASGNENQWGSITYYFKQN